MASPLPLISSDQKSFQEKAFTPSAAHRGPKSQHLVREGVFASVVLALIALGIHGYHPYAEDGGLYFTAVLKTLHPALYPIFPPFASALTRYSAFAPFVALLVRVSGLSPAIVFVSLYLLSVWATLFGAWLIAVQCFHSRFACYGAGSLLAFWLTLPATGTSILLVDPYLTARGISTPCSLFALAAMLQVCSTRRFDRRLLRRGSATVVLWITIAGLFHPLMSGYAAGCLLLLYADSLPARIRRTAVIGLCATAIAVAATLYETGAPVAPNYLIAARSRAYWFLQNWHWYELVGLVAPLLVLFLATRSRPLSSIGNARRIARMAFAAGTTAIVIALLFVHESSRTYAIARLQPLRIFQLIYLVMVVVLGGTVGKRIIQTWRWKALTVAFALGGLMFYVQRQTFPDSAHIELPGKTPGNGWEQAFLWAAHNTSPGAIFALDARYIAYPGEDSQYFSAIAQRSALPDYSKDGGLAAITPQFAKLWMLAQQAQTGLNSASDAERLANLRSFSVSWIVLPTASKTAFSCPFQDSAAKVCKLGRI